MRSQASGVEVRFTGGEVAEQVAAQAALTPAATAVVAGDEQIGYRDLDQRANRLARNLVELGVGPDVLVGLCFERSVALIVAALGVLKAAGAYLPLDPGYPRDRIAFMLEDAHAPVVLTDHRLAGSLPEGAWRTLGLDSCASELSPGDPDPPDIRVATDNLAYVIYTSGSTGRPKGVEITRDGLSNLILWHQRAFDVTRADRATQIASPAFDGAVWEIWPYLTAGASIHIPDESTRLDPALLRDWLVEHEITISFLPTPMAESAMVLAWPPEAALRTLLTGADRLHRPPPPGLPFALINNYGPTEATVVATSGLIPPRNGSGPLPSIGSPIDNTHAYVLDEDLNLVPDGTPGELFIGGRGVARGYRNRPDLTAERFLPDGFSNVAGARMYRTGDLVRTRADGALDFIGRIDQQVKIRGFRIELGEVEAVLVEHPDVHQAVAALREDATGGRSLLACAVSAPGAQPKADELRNFLRTRLPDYMVPARVVLLEALPLTPNGKVDRGAVATLRVEDPAAEINLDPPRTLIEERLGGIVCQLLKLEHVGLEDNFFLLGGHSLLGAQLVARVNDGFGVALPLRTLFDIPTVAGLSAEIERLVLAKLDAVSAAHSGP